MVRSRCFCLRTCASLALLVCLQAPALAAEFSPPPVKPAAATGVLRGHEQDVQKNTHGLGFSAAVNPLLGFTYRRYFGNSAVQLNVLPLLADSGNYLSLHFGVEVIDYMLVWTRGGRNSALMNVPTTALRLVGAAGVSLERDQSTNISVPDANCQTQVCKDAIQGNHGRIDYLGSVGAGFGFEFGAIMRPGFSLALDLMMTVLWDNDGFYATYPLPYGTLMYNW